MSTPSEHDLTVMVEDSSMSARLRLADGSSWPRPALESDDELSPAWRARYSPLSLEHSDLLTLASIAEAYSYLLSLPRRERDVKVRMIRESLAKEVAS